METGTLLAIIFAFKIPFYIKLKTLLEYLLVQEKKGKEMKVMIDFNFVVRSFDKDTSYVSTY